MLLIGRVVDQNIQLSELLNCALDSLSTEFGIGNVALDQNRFALLFLNGLFGLVSIFLFLREMHQSHIRSFSGEQDRHGPTDATVAAGDEGDLALQFIAAPVIFSDVFRLGVHPVFLARLPVLVLSWASFLLYFFRL